MAGVLILAITATADGDEILRLPTWEEFVAAMDATDEAREARHKRREVCATDLDTTAEQWSEERHAERLRAKHAKHEKPGTWEGPTARFAILLGGSHPWDGPGATLTPLGNCRGCCHLSKLEPSTYCLHCCRSGLDHIKGIKGTHRKPDDPRPEVKPAGVPTRRQKRKKMAG